RYPGVTEGLLPIEQALVHIIARLARATSTLLLVMDALSYADCCELVQDLGHRGWITPPTPPGYPFPFLGRRVPSMTARARTSLFSGKLTRGTSAEEKQNFAAHAELLAVSR